MTVRTAVDGPTATVTIDRPEALNALNEDVLAGLRDAVTTLPDSVRGIIVTGAGGKAFVAGADIAQMVDMTMEDAARFSALGHAAFDALAEFPGPVIAAVDGFALGGGLELALACDIIVASPGAKVGLPETTLAVVPGWGGTQRLPRRVGVGAAKHLIMSGAVVGAEEALRIGLVDVVAEGTALEAAEGLMAKLQANGPLAVAASKRLVDAADGELSHGMAAEREAFAHLFATADRREGMQAFLEKRRADYKGA